MSAMLRFKDPADYEAWKKSNGLRESKPITGRQNAAATSLSASPSKEGVGELPREVAAAPKESQIERRFVQQLEVAGLVPYMREYYHIPGRLFRLDFAWPNLKIGVEIQDASHRVKSKFHADLEKRQMGLLAGWKVLELGSEDVKNETGIGMLKQLMGV